MESDLQGDAYALRIKRTHISEKFSFMPIILYKESLVIGDFQTGTILLAYDNASSTSSLVV